ncbi:MAG TPA: hypothetical protein VFY26_10765 [Anaerolineales bacterium]|nr:hypothetical protein [Anaerolineales bacterium]
MARKRRKVPKIELHPMFRWIRGKVGKIVYRLAHNGEVSAYPAPDMSGIEWSPAQKAQRRKIAGATPYARLAIRYPDLRQYYVQMAKQTGKNPRRPFDMAVSDYCQGNDLLWQKFYGDREKPADWSWKDVEIPPATNP